MIKVIICDDSATSRELLKYILDSDPDIQVIATVSNGEAAIKAVSDMKPDLLIMDIHMPKMDGFETTRKIMSSQPLPIIIVSATVINQAEATLKAHQAGALAFIRHPPGINHSDFSIVTTEMLKVIKLMSEIKVVRRWAKPHPVSMSDITKKSTAYYSKNTIRLIAIGASTGGPIVLQGILSAIANNLNVPVLVVQHIAPGFLQGLAEMLTSGALPVHVATENELALPGHVYLSPENRHMGISSNGRIKLNDGTHEHGMRPAVSYLFRSVADAMGENAAGILLTGMGIDGAEELKLMREKGALTIAQDEKSSVVYGMPGEAHRIDAAEHILPPIDIASMLLGLLSRTEPKESNVYEN